MNAGGEAVSSPIEGIQSLLKASKVPLDGPHVRSYWEHLKLDHSFASKIFCFLLFLKIESYNPPLLSVM